MIYPKTCVLNQWPAQVRKTCEGEESGKEVLNHSAPGAAPDEVGKPGVCKEALLQFMLWKSMLCVGSPASAFAGIKMLYRCKGDSKANWLPQCYYLVRCLTFVQQGDCHPPFGQGPYAVVLLLWVWCWPEAARVQCTVMPQCGKPQLQILCASGVLDTDACRHPGRLVILLINRV